MSFAADTFTPSATSSRLRSVTDISKSRPKLAQRALRIDRAGQSERLHRLLEHEGGQDVATLRRRRLLEPELQRRPIRAKPRGRDIRGGFLPQFAVEARRGCKLLEKHRPLGDRDHGMRIVAADDGVERLHPQSRRDVLGAAGPPDLAALFARLRRETGFRPRSEVQCERRQPLGAPPNDQRIQKRVRGRIVGLAGRS